MVYSNNEVTGINLEEIRRSTADDRMLSELREKIQNSRASRRDEVNDEQYWPYKDELSIINGVIFKSDRVVIPKKLRSVMLKQLHILHMGTEKTKLRARESMFWPGVNREVEDMVDLCNICIKIKENKKKS